MNKHFLLAAATAALLAASPAHAELRIGGQVGFFETEISQTAAGEAEFASPNLSTGSAQGMASEAGIGAFAQFRRTLDSDLVVGAHLGYGRDSLKFTGGNFTLADGGAATLETGATIDLLGLLAFPGDFYTPVVMFGYSSVEVDEVAGGMREEETLSGWKFMFGAEFAFTEDLILHALLQYADYGGKVLHDFDTDASQTALRFGFALRF